MIDKQQQIAYFENLLAEHGPNHKALDWNSPESQRLRFRIFQEILVYGRKSTGISLLDLGCGLGDLYGYFKTEKLLQKHRLQYTGYDISPKLIEAAQKRFPEADFEVKDLLEAKHLPRFDYILACGIFNIRTGSEEEHLDFIREMIYRMYELAGFGVALNFLSQGTLPIADPQGLNSTQYYYFDPEKILNFVRYACNKYIVRHDYHEGDFTVFLLK
ncbi:MAG: class I SAM-dependent methyltransferase [Candidatus Margulisiibacteriota bacterium]